jgi:hypothetical protein
MTTIRQANTGMYDSSISCSGITFNRYQLSKGTLMSNAMDEEIKSWATRRISVLVSDIIQDNSTVGLRHIASPCGGFCA